MFLVYRVSDLPDPRRTADVWRRESMRLGAGDPYLFSVHNFDADRVDPRPFGFDAAVTFAPDWRRLGPAVQETARQRALRKAFSQRSAYRTNRLHDHRSLVEPVLRSPRAAYTTYPSVCPGFARSLAGPTVVQRCHPRSASGGFERLCCSLGLRDAEKDLVFANAWNEWGEGNYLESCQRWGRGYLKAHERATNEALRRKGSIPASSASLDPS